MESPLHIHNNDDTLEDGAWKDSFDRIIEPRPVLRQLQIIKDNVRASFNMDSSVENDGSSENSLAKNSNQRKTRTNSTPVTKLVYKNPFKCSLSPVGCMKYKQTMANRKSKEPFIELPSITEVVAFAGTPMRQQLTTSDIVYEDIKGPSNSYNFDSNGANDTSSMLDIVFGKERRQRQVCFQLEDSSICIVEPAANDQAVSDNKVPAVTVNTERPQSLTLQPGKWRKSLTLWKRSHNLTTNNRRSSIYVRPSETGVSRRIKVSSAHASQENLAYYGDILSGKCDWKTVVLSYCGQNEELPFEMVYAANKLTNCRKLGEGAFGEVFLNGNSNAKGRNRSKSLESDNVFKIIPIEGNTEVNGERQKMFDTIFPEIFMSIELCNLAKPHSDNSTPNFVNINKVTCVRGAYPQHLIDLWDEYDKDKGSENDHPSIFNDKQLFIVLELSYSGVDMEAFEFQNAEQAYYALQQIILCLAIAEEACQFEHRDLHWGNILVVNTRQKELTAKFRNRSISLPTKGIKVTIIDYTLSRMTFGDGCLYNDLSQDDELFSATGDYQFDIYRMMRDALNNNWQVYEPKTNIFWISYVISKLLNGVTYTSKRTKTHQQYMQILLDLMDHILTFKSATECALFIFKLYN